MTQMQRTNGQSASFSFIGNLINLYSHTPKDIPRIQTWYEDREISKVGGADAQFAREDKGLLTHETTHFLDATTTIWGLEHALREQGSKATHALYTTKSAEFTPLSTYGHPTTPSSASQQYLAA